MPAENPPAADSPLPFSDAAGCRAWLARLPLTDPARCHALLAPPVRQLPAAAIAPSAKLEILELLQEPVVAAQAAMMTRCRGKAIPLYGTGATRRDYTYIDDIVDGVLAAHDLAPGFEIFNLGGSDTTRLSDLVHEIAGALGVEPRIEFQPEQPGDVPITFADVTKARDMLGYVPKVPIREGIRRYVEWYQRTRRGMA